MNNYTDSMRMIRGKLNLTAYDHVGREIWKMAGDNLIVDGAYPITAEALAGVAGAKITKVAVGTNADDPVAGDISITSPTIVPVETVEYPQPGTARFNFTLEYTDAVGMSIVEFGLLSDDGRLFARKVRANIEKTKYMSIVGAWDITI